MDNHCESFGDYLHKLRVEKGVSYRDLAIEIGVSAPYLSDIEKKRRNAPSIALLEKISKYFDLSKQEKEHLFDLAGDDKSEVAPDLPQYIMDHTYVASALRVARDLGAEEDDWKCFVDDLKKRKG